MTELTNLDGEKVLVDFDRDLQIISMGSAGCIISADGEEISVLETLAAINERVDMV